MSEIVVDHKTQAHLLSCMRELIERWGAEAYLTAPILEPTDRDFPDTFAPGLKGVRTVARRMASYAGLGGVGVDVMGKPDADPDPLVHSEIVLSRVEKHEIELAVVEPGRPEDLPIILAQEIARAFLALRASAHRNADHPYRTPELEPDEGSDDENEVEVTVTAMYLGFGLLVTLGADRYRVAHELRAQSAVTRWVHQRVGALAPAHACFLLAAHAIVRAEPDSRIADWRKRLAPNERAALHRFTKELAGDRDELCAALGLPPPTEWPAEWAAVRRDAPVPLADDGWEPRVPDEDEAGEEAAPDDPLPVYRRNRDSRWTWLAAATAIGLVAMVASIGWATEWSLATILGAALGAALAYFAGRAVPRTAVCTHCEALLPEDATSCPGCGGSVRGTIHVGESRLDVEERLERESTEAQTDADPRYVELHVACPHCGWIPDGLAHWDCDVCEVPAFNTFEHGGECPGCGEVFVATFCPACGHVAAYEHWWPDDDAGEDLPSDP